MSTNLQQVVAKSKVSTLDGDLKDIAEQMLRDKFGFEEEVVTQRDRSFQSDGMGFAGTIGIEEIRTRDGSILRVTSEFLDRIRESNRGYYDEIELTSDFRSNRPKARLHISDTNMSSLMSAVKRFRNLNIRHDYLFTMNQDFAYEMMRRDRDFCYYFQRSNRRRGEGERDVYGRIMGIDVVITREIRGCLLEGVF